MPRGTELQAKLLPPPLLLAIVTAGGIYPLLEKEGLIAAKGEGGVGLRRTSCHFGE